MNVLTTLSCLLGKDLICCLFLKEEVVKAPFTGFSPSPPRSPLHPRFLGLSPAQLLSEYLSQGFIFGEIQVKQNPSQSQFKVKRKCSPCCQAREELRGDELNPLRTR